LSKRQGIKGELRGSNRHGGSVSRRDLRTEEGEDLTGGSGLTGGVHASVREGEGPYRFGEREDGPRAASGAGPEWRPRPFYLFFFLSSFSFFCFPFPS
jgi:hypothetical protein